MRLNNVIASDSSSNTSRSKSRTRSSSSSSCFEDIQNQNHLPASSGPSSYGDPAVASYFNNGGGHGVADFFAMKPQVARPDVPQMEACVHSINRISVGIGQLIANASADLGPQNTILELESEKAELVRTLNAQKLEELRNEIDKLRVENSTNVTSELGPIQEQLQMQTQAVGVMVGKKAELMGTVGNFCLQRIGRSFPAPDEIGGKKENSSSWYESGTEQE